MENINALEIAMGTGLVVQLVLFSLILASVFSWAIIFNKWSVFKTAKSQTDKFMGIFWNGKSLGDVFERTSDFPASPVSNVFKAAYQEYQKIINKKIDESGSASKAEIINESMDNLYRSLRKASQNESVRLEKRLSYLATIASTAPFVGLFGTVWGIMNSFMALGQGGAGTIERVAPGISEALIATAVGLAAAIPAVIFYNQYIGKIRLIKIDMDNFSSDFLNILKRSYLK